MNRYAVLYLVTLFVLVPLDFLFLGVVAKDFFTSQVGNMLGEIKLVPAILFYLLYVVGIVIFVSGAAGRDLAIDAALWRAVRPVLLRDLRPHLAGAAQALELAGCDRRRQLGRVRDGGLLDRRPCSWRIGWCRKARSSLRGCAARSSAHQLSASRSMELGMLRFALANDALRRHFGCGTIRI